MNLKEISVDDAKKLPSGTVLWVGQTRQTAVRTKSVGSQVVFGIRTIHKETAVDLGMKFFLETREAVPIEPGEAARRMVDGLPVQAKLRDSDGWCDIGCNSEWKMQEFNREIFRIPAIPPAKQRITIEVDAGVEVPDEFSVWHGNPCEFRATVVSREGE